MERGCEDDMATVLQIFSISWSPHLFSFPMTLLFIGKVGFSLHPKNVETCVSTLK